MVLTHGFTSQNNAKWPTNQGVWIWIKAPQSTYHIWRTFQVDILKLYWGHMRTKVVLMRTWGQGLSSESDHQSARVPRNGTFWHVSNFGLAFRCSEWNRVLSAWMDFKGTLKSLSVKYSLIRWLTFRRSFNLWQTSYLMHLYKKSLVCHLYIDFSYSIFIFSFWMCVGH